MVVFVGFWVTYHNTIIVNASHDCCTGAGSFGKGNASGVKSRVAVVVGEVEAWHRDNAGVVRLGKIRLVDGRQRDVFCCLAKSMAGVEEECSRRE
jgi:hypothetical protein